MGHTSFPKTSRLKLASDFRGLIKSGKSFRENGLVIYFRKSKTDNSRLGIVVSKRVFKRAVDRNRFKRFIREFYRVEKNKLTTPVDIVIRAVESLKLLTQKDLEHCLKRLFQKAKLI